MKLALLHFPCIVLAVLCPISLAVPASPGAAATNSSPDSRLRFGDDTATTDSSKPMQESDNATILAPKPWPPRTYAILLQYPWYISVSATGTTRHSPPSASLIQRFIYEFATNIESAYPPPGLSPRKAHQNFYDTDSFSEFFIEAIVVGFFASRAPVQILSRALSSLAMEVGRHSPPSQINSVISQPKKGIIPFKSFNLITLKIEPLRNALLREDAMNRSRDTFRME